MTPSLRSKPLLRMIWPEARLGSPPPWAAPPGYLIRGYQPGDELDVLDIFFRTEFPSGGGEDAADAQPELDPAGCLLAIERASGEAAGVIMAMPHPTARHPHGAELSWLAVVPEHRGRGLGRELLAAASAYLLGQGFRDLYFKTEDHRLFALNIYLKLGFAPLLFESAQARRWQAICRKLRWPFTPEAWPTHPVT